MQMTNLSEAMQILTVIPGESGTANPRRPLCIELGEPHPEDRKRPARAGMPSPVLDLDVWCTANKAALGELADPKKLIAHLSKSRVFRLAIDGSKGEDGAWLVMPEIAVA